MATENGFSNQKKIGNAQYKTIHNLGSDRYGPPVSNKSLFELNAIAVSIVSVAETDDKKEVYVEITGHNAQVGDVLRIMTGNLTSYEFPITEIVDANILTIPNIASELVVIGNTVKVMRWVTNKTDAEGNVNFSPGPTTFIKDGATVTVTEDTVTPANNEPFPVKLTGVTGDINITANDLNVQLSASGANPDSVRIGDGTETLLIDVDGSAKVRDADAITQLTSIAGEDFATQTTLAAVLAKIIAAPATEAKQDTANTSLASLLAELQLKADLTETQPVSAASLPLPTGAATALKQDALLAELQLKADLTETQPVSAASLPLPTGAATALKQDALLAELQLKADLTETQPVSAASLPLPTGAATETTLGNLLTELQLKADLTESQPVISKSGSSGGYEQHSVGTVTVLSTAKTGVAKMVTIQANPDNAGNVRYRIDGIDPSASVGLILLPGQDRTIEGNVNVRMLSASGTNEVNVEFIYE